MKNLTTIYLLFLVFNINAQEYTTPNTGVNWSLSDINMDSPDTLSVEGTTYTLSADLIVAENDTLEIREDDLTLKVGEELRITIAGTLIISSNLMVTATDTLFPYDGIRLEQGSTVRLDNLILEYGGGIRVLTEDFEVQNSIFRNNVSGVSTGSVLSFTRGNPIIINNSFINNETPAISSGANSGVSGTISNNIMTGNNTANSNRPQINMGVTDGENTLIIKGNTIIGNRELTMVGGIGLSNFVGGEIDALIEDNIITDNRYGISILGSNATVEITNNTVTDNNTENMPLRGGSGISLNTSDSTMNIKASYNTISGNLWGITVIDQASINLGDDAENPGKNTFFNNGNNGAIYAIYNNTPRTISALHNCWTQENQSIATAEEVIFHFNDDATLGEVLFDPISCNLTSTSETEIFDISLYPNPSTGKFTLDLLNESFDYLTVRTISGQIVASQVIEKKINYIDLNLDNGLYIIELHQGHKLHHERMVILK